MEMPRKTLSSPPDKAYYLPVLFLLVFFLVQLTAGGAVAAPASERKLMLLNWSEYFDPEVLEDFTERYGIEVVEGYFETDDMRNEIMVNTKGSGYDLVLCNGSTIAAYAERGWLAPVPEKEVPNLKYVHPRWRNAFPASRDHGVPFLWGTLGIGYRSDKIHTPVTGWLDLFRPDPSLKDKIVMIKTSRDLIGMALKALGYSVNSTDGKQLEEAKALLLRQKPFVKTYSYVSLSEKSVLVSGDALMAMLYSGDALMLQEHEPSITFVQPREGTNLWCDYFVLLNSSTNKDLAYTFLNFIHEPAIMARLAQYAYYGTTNREAEKLLPKEFLEDRTIYPPPEVLEKSEVYAPLPPRITKKYNTIFHTVIH